MKNKGLIIVILFSFSFLFSLFYMNYFSRNIYVKDFNEYTRINVFDEYKSEDINACYGTKFKCKKILYKVKGSVNTSKLGTYNITYIINHKDISVVKTKKVEVVDNTKPILNVEGNFDNVCPSGKNESVKLSAQDNYDGDITDKIEYKISNGKIVYRVQDSSNNSEEKEFNISINDIEKPSLILNGDATMYLSLGAKYEEPGYVAIDNCNGNITDKVKVTGNVNTKKEGTYELSYSIKDDYDNETILKRIVKIFPKNKYNPEVVSNKTIYLTFDDGPGKYTARLLDILKKYDAKVTFFVTGYNNNYNDMLKRAYDEGHTVALHSYTHKYDSIYSSVDSYMEDLLKIQSKVKEYTGVESKIIRFPGGSSNTISRKYKLGIMSELTKKVEEIGFRYFDWTISSGDAGNTKDSNVIYNNVINSIKENSPNVVLMHDIKSYTVDSIENIIQYGLSNGYTFAPLTMESPVVHQKVNN